MERIKSFTINHNILTPGFYISRVDDGDIITYDLRTRKPNAGDYMDNATMHSVEHMIATYIRNSEIADHVIYFGPMGCQTGFYLVVKGVDSKKTFEVVKDVFQKTVDHEGDVFGFIVFRTCLSKSKASEEQTKKATTPIRVQKTSITPSVFLLRRKRGPRSGLFLTAIQMPKNTTTNMLWFIACLDTRTGRA